MSNVNNKRGFRVHPARLAALRERRLVPHPIPCNLVKLDDGSWAERPWFNYVGKDN